IVVVNGAVWVLACLSVLLVSSLWSDDLATISVAPDPLWPTFALGARIMCELSVVCAIAVRSSVRKDF
ncbi:MAG: hypothetical protein K2F72_00785, partial [Muribaculaceae bacterium]|nr:hypothetical protein [Muribaculaceae bacterium]